MDEANTKNIINNINKNNIRYLDSNVLLVSPFLSNEYYCSLIKNIPDVKYYEPKFMNKEETHLFGQERFHLWLKPTIGKFPNMENWNIVADEICNDQFIQTILKKFQYSKKINLLNFKTTVRLVKERFRSILDSHLDRNEKILTMILYLSEENILKPYGTRIYKSYENKIQEHVTFFYYPNTALFILNPNVIYHGVGDFSLSKDRNTLQLFLSRK